ncbi:MAG: hypothetical protein RMY36_032410 [Nostoc sp. SerVER01]|nr:hypothetical protein [Nostoc sp. SerVER01]
MATITGSDQSSERSRKFQENFPGLDLHQENWTSEDQEELDFLQKEFGWFASPQQKLVHEDEYPTN